MKLEPCPFCGCSDWHVMPATMRTFSFGTQISCHKCGAFGPWVASNTADGDEVEMAAKLWNERSRNGNE